MGNTHFISVLIQELNKDVSVSILIKSTVDEIYRETVISKK